MVEYLIDAAARAGASAADSAAAVQSLVPVLQTVTSPVEMEIYLQRVAQRFGHAGHERGAPTVARGKGARPDRRRPS